MLQLVFVVLVLGTSTIRLQETQSGMTEDLMSFRKTVVGDSAVVEFIDDLVPTFRSLDYALAQPRIGKPLDIDVVLLQSKDSSGLVNQSSLSEIDSLRALVDRRSYATALTTSIAVRSVNAPWTDLNDPDLDRLNGAAQELGLGCVSFEGSHHLLHLVRRARTAKTVLLVEKRYGENPPGPILYAIDVSKFPELGTVVMSRGHVVHFYRFVPSRVRRWRASDS